MRERNRKREAAGLTFAEMLEQGREPTNQTKRSETYKPGARRIARQEIKAEQLGHITRNSNAQQSKKRQQKFVTPKQGSAALPPHCTEHAAPCYKSGDYSGTFFGQNGGKAAINRVGKFVIGSSRAAQMANMRQG